MNESIISLSEFFSLREKYPILDARSEAEFEQSHIPNAINIPILNNEERIEVGTIYKNKGNEEAVILGFQLVGPKVSCPYQRSKSSFP
jgi:tRNA 2-selenouridine synthase